MNDLNLFITNIQQVFLGILALAFSILLLTQKNDFKEYINKDQKILVISYFISIVVGLTYTFLLSWSDVGLFFSVEFSLLIGMSLLSPQFAVSFFLYLLLSRPWETFDNQLMSSMPRDIFYMVFFSLVGHKLLRKQFYFRLNLGTVLIIFFSFWVFLSAFFSGHQSLAIQKYAEIFTKGIILFILIQNSFEKPYQIISAKVALVLAILEKSIISVYHTLVMESQNTSGVAENVTQRLESVGILSNSNDIAAIFILAIPFIVTLILKTGLRPVHWILAIFTLMSMSYLVWESQSRGAMLALFASLASYFFLKVKKTKHILLIGALVVTAALGSFSLMNRGAKDLEGSTSNRVIFWKAGANMAIRNPVFGVGFWGFNRHFASYAIDGDTGTEGTHMTAHSSWVQVFAETGFMGLFFFVSLWIYAFYRSWLIRQTQPEYFMSLTGYAVAMTFLSHAYLLFPYIILALVITHSFVMKRKSENVENNDFSSVLLGAKT